MIIRFLLPLLLVVIGIASLVDGLYVVGSTCGLVAVFLFVVAALIPNAP